MKKGDIEIFEKIQAQLHGLYKEMVIFSKKKPDAVVNKFKLKFINKILNDTNTLLDEKNKPFDDFNTFEEDLLPTNSDVVMILDQYINCFEKYRSENILFDDDSEEWYWKINGRQSDVRTVPPKKLNY